MTSERESPNEAETTPQENRIPNLTQIQQYIIQDYLGHGSYTKAYLVETKRSRTKLVLRNYPREEYREKTSSAGLREIELLRKLHSEKDPMGQNHCIIPLIDHFDHSRYGLCVVTPYFEFSLADYVNDHLERPISQARLKNYAFQLLTAVQHCHVNGVIHGDIKPRNIMVNRRGYVLRLTDFNTSRALENVFKGAAMHETMTTLSYRAPELLLKEGKERYTDACDMW
jgi:serine/threonine protein kinase